MAKKENVKVELPGDSITENPKKARKEAMLKLAEYLKKHKLDPEKDWSKDKVHGKNLEKYYQVIRVSEQKIKSAQANLIKPEVHAKVKKVTKPVNAYNYPDLDGQPMSAQMKKKYRAKMRALLKSGMEVKKAEEIALGFAKRWDNSSNPEEKVLRKKSTKTGKEATVELKTKDKASKEEPKKDKVKKDKKQKISKVKSDSNKNISGKKRVVVDDED